MQASSIAIITGGVMPCMRSIVRIMVPHMSAQFMHEVAQSISCVEQTVQACSQAAQASMHACIIAMSIAAMPSIIIMSSDMAFIIMESITHPLSIGDGHRDLRLVCSRRKPPACRHGTAQGAPRTGSRRLVRVLSHRIHTRPFALPALAAAVIALMMGVALVLVSPAAPASAHDELIGSSPAAGAEVDAVPDELVLTFSGVLLDEPGATQVVVTDAAGTDLTDGDPTLDGTKLTQPLAADTAAAGTVTVIWRVVSSDGHPVSDQFSFSVAGGTPVTSAPSSSATAAADATPAPGPSMEATDMTWVWIALPLALVVAFVGVLLWARKRGPRED